MRSSLLVALLLLGACKRSNPDPVPVSDPITTAAEPRPTPPKKVAEPLSHRAPARKGPPRPLTTSEKALVGTWVATVGDYAPRSAFMADKVMLALGGSRKKDFVSSTLEAIKRDDRVRTNCVWLELFDDLSGIRRECALVNGQASALDKTDPLTGKKTDLGTHLRWSYDQKQRTVQIDLDADMIVPLADEKGVRKVRFRKWQLAFGEKRAKGFKIKETIPEHSYTLPVQYVYEIFPGRFLGRR